MDRTGTSLQEPDAQRRFHGLPAIGGRELVQDVRDVIADRPAAEEERGGNLLVSLAPGDVVEHFRLAVGQDARVKKRRVAGAIEFQWWVDQCEPRQLAAGAFHAATP
jgi:hypothetical protein